MGIWQFLCWYVFSPLCRKSLCDFGNVPVFGRSWPDGVVKYLCVQSQTGGSGTH